MKVSLDVTAVPARPAGAGRYVLELARGLGRMTDMDTYLYARVDDGVRWELLEGDAHVRAVAPRSRPLRLAWEQARLPSLLTNDFIGVHHAPHYTMPERAKTPVVVTIHDMTFFTNPEWHERSKVLLFRRAISVAVKKATQLVAVSHDTAMRMQERFGEVPVTVIPHGIDHARFNPKKSASERVELTNAGIPDEYIAFLGTIEPRKNLPQLIRAFDRIASKHPSLHLVIAGQRGWQLEEFDRTLSASAHRNRVIVSGYLAEALVPALLRNAHAVAYPSLVEGFGLPALEAMACGAPVVVGDGSAMREVARGAGIFVNQNDVDSLVAGLEVALESSGDAGVEAAKKFTWVNAVDAHIEVYEKAARS